MKIRAQIWLLSSASQHRGLSLPCFLTTLQAMDLPPTSKLKSHGRIAFPRHKRSIAGIAVSGKDLRLNNSSGEAFITSLERREQTEESCRETPQILFLLLLLLSSLTHNFHKSHPLCCPFIVCGSRAGGRGAQLQ